MPKTGCLEGVERSNQSRKLLCTVCARQAPPRACITGPRTQSWHLCGWIERIPGGTRQHDGLETGIMWGCGRANSMGMPGAAHVVPPRIF